MSEPNWDDVRYLLHYKDSGALHIYPASNAVGHGFPETLLRTVTDGIDAEKAFLEFQAANPKRREVLASVWYQIPGKPWYRIEIRKAPDTIGSVVGDLSGKRLPKRPRGSSGERCDNVARYVEVAKASPMVGVALRTVCTCGLTHFAKALDGYRAATDVPISVVDGILGVTRPIDLGYRISGPWVAAQQGGEFPHAVYRAPVERIEDGQ
ncbi:hypothetical protein ACIOJE_07785 [Kitasatospora sp. NPDC087861]|uniref:hypothetical protein n=1 Tax=Kitasatospora sp. NPDC087861 TaxID=3364070 RepID=UPI003803304F